MIEEKRVYYPGMFDLLKGITIIGIIMTHISDLFPDELLFSGGMSLLKKAFVLSIKTTSSGNATLPVLFLISGFGFTAIDLKKCVKKQKNQLLKPFLFTGAAAAAVHLVAHYCSFHYFPGAIKQTGILFFSHLLGLQTGFQIGGIQLCSIGSVWFLLALFEGWILMTFVIDYLPNWCHKFLAICFVVLSFLLLVFAPPWISYPFCFSFLFLCAGNLYFGMQIRKNNWLWNPLPSAAWILMVLFAVASNFILYTPVAHPLYSVFAFCAYCIGSECSAFLLMWIFVRINRWNSWFFDKIRVIGRYSLWILCAHTIESQGLPWYLFVEKWAGHEFAAFLAMIVIRSLLIFGMYRLFCSFNKWKRKNKRRRRASEGV